MPLLNEGNTKQPKDNKLVALKRDLRGGETSVTKPDVKFP